MLKAIDMVESDRGMGLWFPCPADYQPDEFLSSLSDNLASVVEHRSIQAALRMQWRRRALLFLAALLALLVVVQVVFYPTHTGLNDAWLHRLWIGLSLLIIGCALLTLIALIAFALPIHPAANQRRELAQEATALRQRIRYTTELKVASEFGVSGGTSFTASGKQSMERSYAERPTTVASLVFDFRRLAEHIVEVQRRPLVIGIDELDKVDKPGAVSDLLRDIKGIFEITGVFFLVSVSEEATAALQLGPLQENGRNEFNSSFYTVLELPPLSPAEVGCALKKRDNLVTAERARLLCLLSAGNWRDMVRLAEVTDPADKLDDAALARSTLKAEAVALQQQIIRHCARSGKDGTVPAKARGALTPESFDSTDKFVDMGERAIRDNWDLDPGDRTLQDSLREPWRRLLIRLFVIGQVIAATQPARRVKKSAVPFSDNDICDLRNALIMAGHSTSEALNMLRPRFGDQLPDR
jgi:hypothetical protein